VRFSSLETTVNIKKYLKCTNSNNSTNQKSIFILRDEQRLAVLNYKVLREIFGHNREKVIGGWKKLRNEEIQTSQLSPDNIRAITTRKMRSAGLVA
jgi:hypothetical protein